MKPLLVLLILFITGCKQKPDKGNLPVANRDSVVTLKPGEADIEGREEIEERPGADSLRLDSLLKAVLKLARENKNKLFMQGQIDSTGFKYKNIFATRSLGNIFSKDRKHLLIKRFTETGIQGAMYSDIYILRNGRFTKLISDTADIGYSADTLLDVNSDGYKDYIVSSYSGVGCCPRDARNGYLYNKQTGGFEAVSFFNPEFDYAKKVFYEFDYGFPGEVAIEKYQWNGFRKIKIESIIPTTINRPDSFARPYTFTRISYPGERRQIVKNVPDEYKKLEIYEYFISYQD